MYKLYIGRSERDNYARGDAIISVESPGIEVYTKAKQHVNNIRRQHLM